MDSTQNVEKSTVLLPVVVAPDMSELLPTVDPSVSLILIAQVIRLVFKRNVETLVMVPAVLTQNVARLITVHSASVSLAMKEIHM